MIFSESNPKQRIDKLKSCIRLMHEISREDIPESRYQHDTEDSLRREAIRIFRAIDFGNDFEMVTKRVKLFNIIFLHKYGTEI